MKKKNSVLKIILVLITLILIFFIYNIFNLNNLKSNISIFNAENSEKSKFIGIVDDKYYKIEENVFKGYDENKQLFSINVLGIKNIIYDKYIYLVEELGRIRVLDRNTGKELIINDKFERIEAVKLIEDKLVLFHKNSIDIVNKKLKIEKTIKNLENPVDIEFNDSGYSIIQLKHSESKIYSKYIISDGKEITFNLIATNELFIATRKFSDYQLLFTNKYIYQIKENSIVSKIMIEKINSFDINDEKLVVADNGKLRIFDAQLKEIVTRNINTDIKKISIKNNSIIILSKDKLYLYQNDNLVEQDIEQWMDYYESKKAFYIIFKNKIEKVKSY